LFYDRVYSHGKEELEILLNNTIKFCTGREMMCNGWITLVQVIGYFGSQSMSSEGLD